MDQGVTINANSSFALIVLPQELRLAILALLIVFTEPLVLKPGLDLSTFVALSRTWKSIHMEAIKLFFGKKTFAIPRELDRDQDLFSKAAVAFTAQISFLKIQYLVGHDDRSWHVVMKHVRMIKTLKSCMTVPYGCRIDCAWRSPMPTKEDRSLQRERTVVKSHRPGV